MRNAPRRTVAPDAVPDVAPDVRPAVPACSTGRFFAYWLLALTAAVAAFASHIYIRHRVVELGYALGQERALRARMENERRDLELELAAMEAPGDLARVARDVLGLDVPRDDQLLAVGSAAATGPVSGEPAESALVLRPPPAARPAEPAAESPPPSGGAAPAGEEAP